MAIRTITARTMSRKDSRAQSSSLRRGFIAVSVAVATILGAGIAGNHAHAEQAKATSRAASKTAVENKLVRPLFVGDSLTAQLEGIGENDVEKLESFNLAFREFKSRFRSYGMDVRIPRNSVNGFVGKGSGHILRVLKNRTFQQEVRAKGYTEIFIEMGANDLRVKKQGKNEPQEDFIKRCRVKAEEVIRNLNESYKAARAINPKMRVIAVTLPPMFGYGGSGEPQERTRDMINDWIRKSSPVDAVVDLDLQFQTNPKSTDPADAAGRSLKLVFRRDGRDRVHYNQEGIEAMVDEYALQGYADVINSGESRMAETAGKKNADPLLVRPLFLGDSLTHQFNGRGGRVKIRRESFMEKFAGFRRRFSEKGMRVEVAEESVMGFGGRKTWRFVKLLYNPKVQRRISKIRFTDVFLQMGANDIREEVPVKGSSESDAALKRRCRASADRIILNLQRSYILMRRIHPNIRVVAVTLPPAFGFHGLEEAKERTRDMVNAWIRTKANVDAVVDLDTEFQTDPGSTDPTDGVGRSLKVQYRNKGTDLVHTNEEGTIKRLELYVTHGYPKKR